MALIACMWKVERRCRLYFVFYRFTWRAAVSVMLVLVFRPTENSLTLYPIYRSVLQL
jgi:hypothetical protein